jgi:hypothetical protein
MEGAVVGSGDDDVDGAASVELLTNVKKWNGELDLRRRREGDARLVHRCVPFATEERHSSWGGTRS